MPPRPVLEECVVILEQGVAFCINNTSGEERDISLQDMDKFSCFSPQDRGELMAYVKKLIDRIQSKKEKQAAKKELSKWHFNSL